MTKKEFRNLQLTYFAIKNEYDRINKLLSKELTQYDDLLFSDNETDIGKYIDIEMQLREKYNLNKLEQEYWDIQKQLVERGLKFLITLPEFNLFTPEQQATVLEMCNQPIKYVVYMDEIADILSKMQV